MWRLVDTLGVFAGWESEGGCGQGGRDKRGKTGADGVGGYVWRVFGFLLRKRGKI